MEAVHTSIAACRDRSKSRWKQVRQRQPASASLSNVRAPGPPSIATSCNSWNGRNADNWASNLWLGLTAVFNCPRLIEMCPRLTFPTCSDAAAVPLALLLGDPLDLEPSNRAYSLSWGRVGVVDLKRCMAICEGSRVRLVMVQPMMILRSCQCEGVIEDAVLVGFALDTTGDTVEEEFLVSRVVFPRTIAAPLWRQQLHMPSTNRIPYYSHTHTCSISVGPLLTWLDGQWMGEPYPSTNRWLYGCTHQTVQCRALKGHTLHHRRSSWSCPLDGHKSN